MLLLILFAFIAGFITILSPCILPVLPIVLSGSIGGGHRRPLGIVIGFIGSFTVFTLFLSAIVRATGISADFLRASSVLIVVLFGISLLLPQFQVIMEKLFTRLSSLVTANSSRGTGFLSGIFLGISLGLVWTPCVGPIIASVITLAATSSVTTSAIFITLAYSTGTAIPMFLITYGGRKLLQKVPWLLKNTGRIQKVFGVMMILVALAIFFNFDRSFQTFILDKFPQYGSGLTKFEEIAFKNTDMPEVIKNSKSYPQAAELISGGEWINTKPLTLFELRGKVVLVDFWTYTCINCIRTFPYLKDWYQKYNRKGFVIIGVHTPEFEFEKKTENVKKAVTDFDLKYPVMQDNNYATWEAYNNMYWPAHYLIDKDGKIRYVHFGEGEYDKTEKKIQELLIETGEKISDKISNPSYDINSLTPETYLGYRRMEGLTSSQKIVKDTAYSYQLPSSLAQNEFAFDGKWTIKDDMALGEVESAIEYVFNAQKVFLVMNPIDKGSRIKLKLDGKDYKELEIDSNKLYELVELDKPGSHKLRLEIMKGSIAAFAFTFG